MLKSQVPPSAVVAKPKKPKKKELVAEALRQRDIVKTVIWPILLRNATSVKQAKNICKTLAVGMDAIFMQKIQEYQRYMSGETLDKLDLKGFMNAGKAFAGEWELMEALQHEKIADAKGLIDGMEKEIQRLLDKEELARPLSELKTEFL